MINIKNKKEAQHPENDTVGIYGQPQNVFQLIHKYGTYEIQPTSDSDNDFPKIAQGLPEKELRTKDPHYENKHFLKDECEQNK